MERWVIVGFMIAILMMLAAAGWHFHESSQESGTICGSPEARCGEPRL